MGIETVRVIRFLVLIAVVGLAPGATARGGGPQQGRDVVELDADLVDITLTVRDGDRFVPGLAREEFRVLEDGSPQEIVFFEATDIPMSVVLLLDTSASMRRAIGMLQGSAVRFVGELRSIDEVSVVSFGGAVREVAPFTADRARLSEAIAATYADGGTLLYDAVIRSLKQLEATQGRRALVLLTDGADTASAVSGDAVMKRCGQLSVPIYSIGLGDALEDDGLKQALEELSERTGGKAFFVKKLEDVGRAFAEVSSSLRSSYRLGYYRTAAADGKWHRIDVQLPNRKARVLARQGFYASPRRRS